MHSSALSAEHSMAEVGVAGCASAAACLRVVRRRRQLLAKQATAGKLAKAYNRIVELEAEVAVLRASHLAAAGLPDVPTSFDSPVQIATGPTAMEELQARLALIAPVILQGVHTARAQQGSWAHKLSSLVVARRNAAAHCFCTTASAIGSMSQRALNAVQRGRRKLKVPGSDASRQSLPLAWLAFLIVWGTLGLTGLLLQARAPMLVAYGIATDADRAQPGRSCRLEVYEGCLDPVHYMPEDEMMQKYVAMEEVSPIPEVFRSLLPLMEEEWSESFGEADDNDDGALDYGELARFSQGYWTEAEVAAFILDTDANEDGVLDFDEYADEQERQMLAVALPMEAPSCARVVDEGGHLLT